MATRLKYDFFARDTIQVSRELLGTRLVHRFPDGRRVAGRIVETEAYLGVEDQAAHSFGGRRTGRTEPMFGPAGVSYIYFIYGVYFCFNIVTAERGVPEAVLIRALEPVEGLDEMRRRRPGVPDESLSNGPGKLCLALGLDRRQNGVDLTTSPELFLEADVAVRDVDIVDGPRIGLGDRYDAVHWPLRFGVRGHSSLSPAKFPD